MESELQLCHSERSEESRSVIRGILSVRFGWLFLFITLARPLSTLAATAQTSDPPHYAASTLESRQPNSPQPAHPAYHLTPEQRAKAVSYSHAQYRLYFLGTLVSVAIYFLLWISGASRVFRDWARRVSPHHFVQCVIFVPLFVAVASALNFPVDYYGDFALEHRVGLSTQGLASWLADWAKSLGITAVLAIVGVWLFYALVRRSPRHWWVYFWAALMPLALAFILIEPYVVEPLFYRFTPLSQTQPELVERIETMLHHAGLAIPRQRVFEMDASSKTRALNAYVSGLGASKRVVVWDTTLRAMSTDELLLVLGHETGHYALHHIPKEFAADEGVALVFCFLGYFALNRLALLRLRGDTAAVGDLASLPWALIVFTLILFLSSPIVNGISRHFEHQADQFGLEVAYGVVPDPNAAEVQSLQKLGEQDLSDPDPSPFIKIWLYTHPPIDERIRFAASYKPWAEGNPLELFPGRQ